MNLPTKNQYLTIISTNKFTTKEKLLPDKLIRNLNFPKNYFHYKTAQRINHHSETTKSIP